MTRWLEHREEFTAVNLSVRAMELSTFYHNTLMKAQAQRVIVHENCDEYKRLWEIWCVIVTKVTTTDGDSLNNTSYRAVWSTERESLSLVSLN